MLTGARSLLLASAMTLRNNPDRKVAGLVLMAGQAVAAYGLLGSVSAAPAAAPARFQFSIDQDTVAHELQHFAIVTGVALLYDDDLEMAGRAVHGRYSAEEALIRLLRGTGLTCVRIHGGAAITVRPLMSGDHSLQDQCLTLEPRPMWDAGPMAVPNELPSVSVLGTHIHGGALTGSRILTWDEQQIRYSGARNLPDLLAAATQNFGGGPNQQTHFGQAETYTNTGLGTGINLRGLGARATLVLLNGHRVAPSGSAASFVDVLNFPLSVVHRVEIMLDGASAVYGSDAVGGVVNIITKNEYVAPETFAQVGSVTSGHQEQHVFSQSIGAGWDGGNLLFVGEVMHDGALAADERWQNSSLLRQLPDEGQAIYSNPGNLFWGEGRFRSPQGRARDRWISRSCSLDH